MAQRIHRDFKHVKHGAIALTARLRGAGAADLSVEDDGETALPSEIVSATRTGVGTFTVVFRHKYPSRLGFPIFSFLGPNGGMNGKCTAYDPAAGTATFLIAYNSTPTDPTTADYIDVAWTVSNSGAIRQ